MEVQVAVQAVVSHQVGRNQAVLQQHVKVT
jgi:hypothetical protein